MGKVETYVGLLSVLVGVFTIAAICLRWDWIMNHYKVRDVFQILGNTGATVFYVVLGLGFVIMGILMVMGILQFST